MKSYIHYKQQTANRLKIYQKQQSFNIGVRMLATTYTTGQSGFQKLRSLL